MPVTGRLSEGRRRLSASTRPAPGSRLPDRLEIAEPRKCSPGTTQPGDKSDQLRSQNFPCSVWGLPDGVDGVQLQPFCCAVSTQEPV